MSDWLLWFVTDEYNIITHCSMNICLYVCLHCIAVLLHIDLSSIQHLMAASVSINSVQFKSYRVCQKSDTLINYVNKLQTPDIYNIRYYWFTQLCAQCVQDAAVQPKRVFCSMQWCTILLESPSVLTTLGSDIRQQSFTKNTWTHSNTSCLLLLPVQWK